MCGINGIVAYNSSAPEPSRAELLATRDHMAARGPDGVGEWWSDNRRAALGHRRLAILDLSERGSQPMTSDDGRFVVTFNGEIYNYPRLRSELQAEGVSFRTTSDTEILLHLFARDGESMVHRLRGMFAFGIWDTLRSCLFLARDPYGIKPLYVADDGWHYRFASQVKALLAGGRVSRNPDPAGIVGFHLWGSVPEPFTCFQAIRSLPAGHFQWVTEAGPREPRCYASVARVLSADAQIEASRDKLESLVRTSLRESVDCHLLADVEVGVFLSAGVDSGALLGVMHDLGRRSMPAVTLTFDDYKGTADDEVPLAETVASEYGARHFTRTVREAEFLADLPRIFDAMDQPSIDGVNTWFVAKAARECGLKVALSGLGGDELFGGYSSFRDIPRWSRWLRLPSSVPGLGRLTRVLGRAVGAGAKRPKALGLLEFGDSYAGVYFLRRGLFLPFELETHLDPELLRQGLQNLKHIDRLRLVALSPAARQPIARVAALEATWYMRHQLLRDCDWAGMAHSLEIRTPLVDFELLRSLAPVFPAVAARGKALLAAAPTNPLPASVVQRHKTGFTVPTVRWAMSAMGQPRSISRGGESRFWGKHVFASQNATSMHGKTVGEC